MLQKCERNLQHFNSVSLIWLQSFLNHNIYGVLSCHSSIVLHNNLLELPAKHVHMFTVNFVNKTISTVFQAISWDIKEAMSSSFISCGALRPRKSINLQRTHHSCVRLNNLIVSYFCSYIVENGFWSILANLMEILHLFNRTLNALSVSLHNTTLTVNEKRKTQLFSC